MDTALSNESFDGSPVEFRLDSPLLIWFDPATLDMLGDLLRSGSPFDVDELLSRANANHPAVACLRIPDFRPGLYHLDPHDIEKFGDDDDDFDYGESESEPGDQAPEYQFAAVDSGALIFADVVHLPTLVTLLTWEQYDRFLRGDTVLPGIVEGLGGPYFAVVGADSRPGMQFDGDGTYTVPAACVRQSRG